ncbi:hypothetical protein SAMN04515617_109142 [Collimonas sp. OK242]|jgi:hypothetical protein|nr:hypothetical protein SAMN04515617_109142 [Collimonas sp. OK242]
MLTLLLPIPSLEPSWTQMSGVTLDYIGFLLREPGDNDKPGMLRREGKVKLNDAVY